MSDTGGPAAPGREDGQDGQDGRNGEERRSGKGRKVVAPLLVLAVLAVGAHLWLNTNAFGHDEVCGGLLSADTAAAVFPSSGRVSDRDGLGTRPDDRLALTCTVESTSFLPGAETGSIRISVGRERGDFPFADDGRWPNPAAVSFFSGGATDGTTGGVAGGATGGVGDGHGWVLLPAGCTDAAGPAAVEGYAPEGSDPVRFAGLLTEVANRAAERAGCSAGEPLRAPTGLAAASEPRPVGDGAVCGLAGMAFPGPERRPGAKQIVQEDPRPTWTCEIEGYADYAVVQEPRIVEGVRSSPGFTGQPSVAGRRASGFDPWHVVTDCAGTPTYFALRTGPDYNDAAGTPGTPRMRELFDGFVEAAGKRLGC
ncbi:hypothetical protein [Streptomyces cinereoruber]